MSFHPDLRPKPRTWDGRKLSPKTIVEVKHDGWRATIYANEFGRKKLLDRRGLDLLSSCTPKGSQQLSQKLGEDMPPETWVDGELLAPNGEPASRVTHYLARDPGKLSFQPFAVPFYAGEDQRYRLTWYGLDSSLFGLGFANPPQRFELGETTKEELSVDAFERGIEGYVLKEMHYGGWWKIKPVDTADLVVVGTKPGKGKHEGKLGALICAAIAPDKLCLGLFDNNYFVQVASVGKGCDEDWRDARNEDVLGRVCEVSYEGLQSKGKMKFSSFVRWRDDKEMQDATTYAELLEGRQT